MPMSRGGSRWKPVHRSESLYCGHIGHCRRRAVSGGGSGCGSGWTDTAAAYHFGGTLVSEHENTPQTAPEEAASALPRSRC